MSSTSSSSSSSSSASSTSTTASSSSSSTIQSKSSTQQFKRPIPPTTDEIAAKHTIKTQKRVRFADEVMDKKDQAQDQAAAIQANGIRSTSAEHPELDMTLTQLKAKFVEKTDSSSLTDAQTAFFATMEQEIWPDCCYLRQECQDKKFGDVTLREFGQVLCAILNRQYYFPAPSYKTIDYMLTAASWFKHPLFTQLLPIGEANDRIIKYAEKLPLGMKMWFNTSDNMKTLLEGMIEYKASQALFNANRVSGDMQFFQMANPIDAAVAAEASAKRMEMSVEARGKTDSEVKA